MRLYLTSPIATQPVTQGGQWGLRAQAARAAATEQAGQSRCCRNRASEPNTSARAASRRAQATLSAVARDLSRKVLGNSTR